MPSQIVLNVTAGPIKGQSFTFDEHDTFIFGRESDCHARLSKDDNTASRHHFLLEANPPAAAICDLGSLNGTYINGEKYGGRPKHLTPEQARAFTSESIKLKNGDEIKVGSTVFSVQIQTPTYCSYCNNEITENELNSKEDSALPICTSCENRSRKGDLLSTVKSVPLCDKCGKNVSAEIPTGVRGNYICLSCRLNAQNDPDTIIEVLQNSNLKEDNYGDFNDYVIHKKLGEGGMGAVYLAHRKSDGLTVALKTMLAQATVNEHARAVFRREIEVTKQLSHPNIVKLYEHGSSGSGFFFTLEYCSGGSVYDLMDEGRIVLDVSEAVRITIQALEGLSFAHNHEKIFVHRDIKPHNILLTATTDGTAKIGDFGLAKSLQNAGLGSMTVTGQTAGSLGFMPREQLTNFKRVKPSGDVWSMAATLYFMITGVPPYDFTRGNVVDVIMQGHIIPIKQLNYEVSNDLAAVIDKALSVDPKERYQDGGEFKSALEKVYTDFSWVYK